MAQHHLHSKEARNFSSRDLRAMSDADAEMLMALARWGSATMQGCPKCGVVRKHYRRQKRRKWRCAECSHEFSVTSGTLLHGHKLSLHEIIALAMKFDVGAKGRSLLEIARDVGCTPKTVQVFFGKLRESLINAMDLSPLKGIVQMDGGYFGGKPRKPNRRIKVSSEMLKVRFGKKKARDPKKPWIEAGMTKRNWHKRANKRVVMSLCESAGPGLGSNRVIAIVCRSENERDVMQMASHFIHPDAQIMTDESPAFNALDGVFEHYTVCHSYEFSTAEGVNDNLCETFYSRARRAEYGVVHGFRPKYLQDYAAEYAWRENHRRVPQRERVHKLFGGLLTSPPSQWWRGYWQGHHRQNELGLDYFLAKRRGTALVSS